MECQFLQLTGPPGTGKTHTLINERIPAACERYGANHVMALSYTNSAAQELRNRNNDLPPENVGTVHSAAWLAIGRPPIAEVENYKDSDGNKRRLLDDWNDENPRYQMSLEGKNIFDGGISSSRAMAARGDDLLWRYNLMRARCEKLDKARPDGGLGDFITTWEKWLDENGYVDFSGILTRAMDIEELPVDAYSAIVDEAQDSSKQQRELFKRWSKRLERVLYAGDDDQVLYGWAGASAEHLMTPVDGKRHQMLGQSYRLPVAVHAYAGKWIKRIQNRVPKRFRPTDQQGEAKHIHGSLRCLESLFPPLEREIKQEGNSVMMLASCDYMLKKIVRFLTSAGVPFWNPYRVNHTRWNPLRSLKKQPRAADRLLAYLGEHGHLWDADALKAFIPHLESKGCLVTGAKTTLKDLGPMPTDPARWYGRALEIFEPDAIARLTPPEVRAFLDHVLPSKRRQYDFPVAVLETFGRAGLTQDPRVVVGTIHSVKGAEADTVILFPDLSVTAYRQWVGGGAGRDSIVRQFYVGMTRAKSKLWLAQPSNRYHVDL